MVGRLLILLLCLDSMGSIAQCPTRLDHSGDHLVASYEIAARLDNVAKTLHAHQTIHWTNTSPDTLHEIRLYLYVNAFAGLHTSFIQRQNGEVFGQSLHNYTDDEWGHIVISTITDDGIKDISDSKRFIQDLDDNPSDSTIVAYTLARPILPGEQRDLELDFTVKMPRLIARSGYSLEGYYLFVHWFPQMCVYEDQGDHWGWNSHQFVPGTEFYADFGDYRVSLDLPRDLALGATGCKTHHLETTDRQVVTYSATSVIDFAWVIYKHFNVYKDQWQDVELELLLPPEHAAQADRMLIAAKQALTYLDEHVGPYAYPRLTIVGPPLHALRSGLMEYPMLITCGTGYGLPEGVRTLESLVVHELTHQYFMAVLANNEKEEAWMDEGFVTYYEDRIIDHYYGAEGGLIDFCGYQIGNAQKSREEYLGMGDLTQGSIGRPGWEFSFGTYKQLIYAKAAVLLKTVEQIISQPIMDDMMRAYYEQYQFTHPTGQDFIDFVGTYINGQTLPYRGEYIAQILRQGVYEATYYDAQVIAVVSDQDIHEATVSNHGGLDLPCTIQWTFDDGHVHKQIVELGHEQTLTYTYDHRLVEVMVDPQMSNYLDADYTNNVWCKVPPEVPAVGASSRAAYWVQSFLHLLTTAL